MRWRDGRKDRIQRRMDERRWLQDWHLAFAWFPVRVNIGGFEHWAWLEWVCEKGTYHHDNVYGGFWTWEYQPRD